MPALLVPFSRKSIRDAPVVPLFSNRIGLKSATPVLLVNVVIPAMLTLPLTFNASGVWSVPIPRLLSVNLSPLASVVDLNVTPSPVDTISTVSLTEAPTANTTVEPLVAV